ALLPRPQTSTPFPTRRSSDLRAKSADEADALLRHLMEGDYVGTAWRALALLQKHLEAKGAPLAPGASTPAHTIEFEADPVLQALIERADEDAPVEHLKAGEAYLPLNEPATETGD